MFSVMILGLPKPSTTPEAVMPPASRIGSREPGEPLKSLTSKPRSARSADSAHPPLPAPSTATVMGSVLVLPPMSFLRISSMDCPLMPSRSALRPSDLRSWPHSREAIWIRLSWTGARTPSSPASSLVGAECRERHR